MLAFERRGSGEPIVLIHGVAHRREAWDRVVDLLADDYDVIALDLPGHGESPNLSLEGVAEPKEAFRVALEELFAHLGVERPTLVGNSLGGLIALEAAHDEIAGGVVALSPAGFWTTELNYIRSLFVTMVTGAVLLRPVTRFVARTRIGKVIMFSWLAKHPTRVPTEDAILYARGMVRAVPTLLRLLSAAYPFEADISADIPVTIAWSEHDRVLFPRQAKTAERVVPHASVFVLRGVGHVPMLDDPALVAQTIRDHMAARPASNTAA